MNADRSAQPFDDAADDVHTDAAARYVCGDGTRAEPRLENQIEQFVRRKEVESGSRRKAKTNGRLAKAHWIDPAAVIFQRNQDAIALLLGRQRQLADGRFSEALAVACAFESVVNRIANQMDQ